ncbi:MAG: hypothetical protein OIF47_06380 [Marinibacterium sp.]|nr:hypothetical protein [Marinibacterium sp.]
MTPKFTLGAVACALVLAACDIPTAAVDPLNAALSGKTLTSGSTTIMLGSDGTISGDGVAGTWEIRDGKFCRTLTQPESLQGSECQTVTLDGDKATFQSPTGRTSSFTLS